MKPIFALILGFLTVTTTAQKNEGTILYTEIFKLEINFDDIPGISEEIKKMIPPEQKIENILYFTQNASLYTRVPKEDNNDDVQYKSNKEDVQINTKMEAPEHFYYQNIQKQEIVESSNLFGKKFLIIGAEKIKWKVTTETKEILGYTCTKATTTIGTENRPVEAWFTTAIPASVGPDKFHYLPGAVLEVIVDGGKHSILATKIDLENVDVSKIEEPKKGKKVTYIEYKKIEAEKRKEILEMHGGKSNFIIKKETIEE